MCLYFVSRPKRLCTIFLWVPHITVQNNSLYRIVKVNTNLFQLSEESDPPSSEDQSWDLISVQNETQPGFAWLTREGSEHHLEVSGLTIEH